MNGQDARDPFLGINEHIRSQARSQVPTYYTIGKILSVAPMVVRAAGMNLDKGDLRIAQHLKPGWVEHLAELEWALTAELPQKIFTGRCECGLASGTATVTRPQETVEGKTTNEATVKHDLPLAVGDDVLLIPSSDGQIYYLVDKIVGVDV